MEIHKIQQLANENGLKLIDEMSVNEMGIDFQIVFVEDKFNRKWVLRIPRRKKLGKQIKQEAKILELVKKHLSIAVPHWQIANSKLIAYPLLENKPVLVFDHYKQDIVWNIDKNSPQFISSLAKTLVEMHNIPEEEAKSIGIKSLKPEQIREEVSENIKIVKGELGISQPLEERWKKWADSDNLWPEFSTFIHGDLYAGHILTDKKAKITGIIDWSEGQINDPTIDFAGHLAVFGEESLKDLIHCYEKFGGRIWDNFFEQTVERFSATALTYAVYALKTNNKEYLNIAKIQLGTE